MRKRLVLSVTLFLTGCFSLSSFVDPVAPLQIAEAFGITATATLTPSPSPTFTLTPSPTPTSVPTFTPTATPPSQVIERVLIVSFDGLRGDAISAAPMVNLIRLMNTGAYTLHAHTISYPVTLPGHASMLSGMCMEKHGVYWNQLLHYNGYSKGVDLFDLTTAAGLRSVMIVGKSKLRQVAEPETTDVFEAHVTEEEIAEAVIAQIPLGFDIMFVHFPGPDARGHRHGWMSNAQFKALQEGDAALSEILIELDKYDLRSSTLVIITADHGGHERTHDGTLQVDYDIPWIVLGPAILPIELTTQVEIMDTAATAAYALELAIPEEWDGVPAFEAFGLPVGDRVEVVCP